MFKGHKGIGFIAASVVVVAGVAVAATTTGEAIASRVLLVGLTLVLLGAMVGLGAVLATCVQRSAHDVSAAYDLGAQLGYDRGYREGRRVGRPVVVPFPQKCSCQKAEMRRSDAR